MLSLFKDFSLASYELYTLVNGEKNEVKMPYDITDF